MQVDPLALRVVAEVARQGSLTRAGAVLGMTQPAVSYQLRRAEDRLGLRLFTRSAAGCRPTPAGEVLLRGLLPGLAQIESALAEVAALARGPALRILADYGFAGLWLMPRLSRFRAAHPGIEVQITAMQQVRAPLPGEAAVRFATAAEAGAGARLLLAEQVVPIAAPSLAVGGALASARLLHLDAPPGAAWLDWPGWFAAQGVLRHPRVGELVLNTLDLVVQAALAGQGVALGWLPLVAPLLAEGRLVALAPVMRRADRGYWLETGGADTAAHRAFADWLTAELA